VHDAVGHYRVALDLGWCLEQLRQVHAFDDPILTVVPVDNSPHQRQIKARAKLAMLAQARCESDRISFFRLM